MLPIDLIIFDLDGTLLDTPGNIAWSVNTTLKHLGLPTRPAQEIYGYIGIGVDRLLTDSLGPENQHLHDQALHFFKNHQRENYYKKVRIYPGIRSMLEYFQTKIKIVISNKNYFVTRISLEHFGLAKYFKKIYGGDAPHLRKPASTKITKILHDYQISPERALIVGDLTIDIATAKNSGIHSVAVTYGLGKIKDLEITQPDFIISKATELKKIIV